MKKVPRLMILLFAVGLLLSACRPGTGVPGEDTSTAPVGEPFPFGDYSIIRSDLAGSVIKTAMLDLTRAVKEAYGVELPHISDWSREEIGADEIAALPEILIGTTNRPESTAVLAELGRDQLTVRHVGNKIVIVGGNDSLTAYAVDLFIKEILPGFAENGLTEEGYRYDMTIEKTYETIHAENAARPVLIRTKYETEDPVIADVIATEDFGADPLGIADSTAAIQSALNACRANGGGTVFLPAGRYLVTGTVTVPTDCVLCGDWQDPIGTGTPEYGTVILAKTREIKTDSVPGSKNALFVLNYNSGVNGLTVFYPEQDIADVKGYGFCFYAGNYDTVSLTRLTMLNAFRGIGLSLEGEVHSLTQGEKIRICALDVGIEMMCSPDVGNHHDIVIDPALWSGASGGYRCADPDALKTYCRKNTTGMLLGDLDDEQFSGVRITGCRTGLSCIKSSAARSSSFWGMFYGLTITDCVRGVNAENLYPTCGFLIANGKIEGSDYAIRHVCPEGGGIKLCATETVGKVSGRIFTDDSPLNGEPLVPSPRPKPAGVLYLVPVEDKNKKHEDVSAILQETLDCAAKTGGVVRIPAGVYSLYRPITVPEGVTLCGVMPIYTRDMADDCGGTVLLSYYGDGPLVTLKENASLSGLRIWYPLYDPVGALALLREAAPVTETAIAVRGEGSGVCVTNTVINAAFVGVDFTGCDSHSIDRIFGCCYRNFIRAGGKNGTVESCLSNLHFILQPHPEHLVYTFFDPDRCDTAAWNDFQSVGSHSDERFELIRTSILRNYCVFLALDGAKDERVQNCFMYASHIFTEADGSEALLINTSADALYRENAMYDAKDSTLRVVNSLRIGGHSVKNENSAIDIVNRFSFCNMSEVPYHSAEGVSDPAETVIYTQKKVLHSCDTLTGVTGVTLTKEEGQVREGTAAWYHKRDGETVIFTLSFNKTDISEYMEDGYLHFRIWVEDLDRMGAGQIELTSSGTCDVREASWYPAEFMKTDGWNEIFLPLNCAMLWEGKPDPKGVNYIRFYSTGSDCSFIIDDIFVCR